jgi:hypothetical protein
VSKHTPSYLVLSIIIAVDRSLEYWQCLILVWSFLSMALFVPICAGVVFIVRLRVDMRLGCVASGCTDSGLPVLSSTPLPSPPNQINPHAAESGIENPRFVRENMTTAGGIGPDVGRWHWSIAKFAINVAMLHCLDSWHHDIGNDRGHYARCYLRR